MGFSDFESFFPLTLSYIKDSELFLSPYNILSLQFQSGQLNFLVSNLDISD